MCIIHIGDLPIEKIHRPETKRKVYLFYLVIQLNQWFVIGADSNNHFIGHAYFYFPMDLHVSLMEIFDEESWANDGN